MTSDIGSMNSSVAEHPFLMKSVVRLKWITENMVNKIHDIVLADRVKIREIADIVNISIAYKTRTKYPTGKIWHEKAIGEMGVCSRNRMTTSEHCLDMFKRNPKEFLRRFITVNETWIHQYMPETKE
ncbi:uncharacterized protein LOC116850248 [Odontomachus brunneus]|uniref:uncharacterized protein LOC116850248 n=1 Tax=Odontomachus brunneus TaxID=486640 RepID=UPI0013F1C63E|nr:uncharacterized protein LOC116850248 [Odontomachus brunneus]